MLTGFLKRRKWLPEAQLQKTENKEQLLFAWDACLPGAELPGIRRHTQEPGREEQRAQ